MNFRVTGGLPGTTHLVRHLFPLPKCIEYLAFTKLCILSRTYPISFNAQNTSVVQEHLVLSFTDAETDSQVGWVMHQSQGAGIRAYMTAKPELRTTV